MSTGPLPCICILSSQGATSDWASLAAKRSEAFPKEKSKMIQQGTLVQLVCGDERGEREVRGAR